MRLEIAGRQIIGSKEPQQDSWRVFNARGEDISNNARAKVVATGDGTLVVVADGIGGYAGGEIASRLACDAFGKAFFTTDGGAADRLLRALEAANAALAEGKRREPDLQDMGCTLIGAYFYQGKMTFVSVGDSLLLRSRDDEIHRVNVDHSYFDYLDRQVLGSNDPQRWSIAVRDARRRASLTLAVTGGDLIADEYGHKPQIAERPLQTNDVIIVASDGIETLDLVQLQNFMMHLRPLGVAGIADALIGAVDGIGQTRSYQDNTTIVVVGASGGAPLTRVQMASRKVEAAPATPESQSLLSRMPAITTNPLVLAGVGLFGVVMLVILLIFAAHLTDSRRVASPENPPPGDQPPRNQRGDADNGASVSAAQNQVPLPAPPASQVPLPGAADARTAVPAGPPAASPSPSVVGAPPANQTSTKPLKFAWNVQQKVYLQGRPRSRQSTSANACQAECERDQACVAYTWYPDENTCALMAEVSGGYSDATAQSGYKQLEAGWQGERLDRQKLQNENRCLNLCLNEARCVAYTFHGDNNCERFSTVTGQIDESNGRSWAKDPR